MLTVPVLSGLKKKSREPVVHLVLLDMRTEPPAFILDVSMTHRFPRRGEFIACRTPVLLFEMSLPLLLDCARDTNGLQPDRLKIHQVQA